ncbi:MAG: hypothetical protein GY870_11290 [archaeon]|nr:hypothetical protein [archaeon]
MKQKILVKSGLLCLFLISITTGFSQISQEDNINLELDVGDISSAAELLEYTCDDTETFNWIDASGSPDLGLSDDGSASHSLPFSFEFYDQAFSTVYICSNGYISFSDTSPSDWSNNPIPSSATEHAYLIAPFWDDLRPGSSPPGGGTIHVMDGNDGGVDYCAISWVDIFHYSSGPEIGTFEVILYENGNIKFQYIDILYTGGGFTCGLNKGDGLNATIYSGITSSTTNLAVLFTPVYDEPPEENVDPVIFHEEDRIIELNSIGEKITWEIYDQTVLDPTYDILVNGSIESTVTDWESGDLAEFSLDTVASSAEDYNVTIIFKDGRGGVAEDQLIVTVTTGLPPQLTHPADINFILGTVENYLVWTISDSYNTSNILYNVTREGVNIESGSWNEVNTINLTLDSLTEGDYEFNLTVEDESGETSDIVMVSASWNFAPKISKPFDVVYTEGGTGNNLKFDISDDNISTTTDPSYILYRGTINIDSGTWESGDIVSTSVDGLAVGSYEYKLVADDGFGKTSESVVTVTVRASGVPQGGGNGDGDDGPLFDPGLVMGIVIGSIGVAGALGAFFLRKKRNSI